MAGIVWAVAAGTCGWRPACAGGGAPELSPVPGVAAGEVAAGEVAADEQAVALRRAQYAIAAGLLKEYPDDFDALRVMGYVHSSHGNLEQMAQCWQRCRELRPDRADIYDQLGRYAVQVERYEEAIAYWQQALKLAPQFPGAHQRIGYAWLSLGDPQQAVAALQAEIAMDPRASQSHFLLGEAHFQLQEFARAKASYQAALQIEPQHSPACYGLIKTCARLGQAEQADSYAKAFQQLETAAMRTDVEARRNFDDLQQMKERLTVTLVDAGRVYHSHNRPAQAEQLWKRAATVNPDSAACRTSLASLYLGQGKTSEALWQLLEAARIEPENADHQQQLGLLHARMGNMASAESALKKAVKLAPQEAAAYRALAKFYLNTRRQSVLARKLAVRAVQLDPVADSYFVLGWASANNGQLPEARAALDTALQLEPDNALYRKLQQAIQNRK